MAEYERLVTGCKNYGIDAYLLDPTETKKLFPLINEKAFLAAIHSPADGTIDPAMLINALTKSAKKNGCKVIFISLFYMNQLVYINIIKLNILYRIKYL